MVSHRHATVELHVCETIGSSILWVINHPRLSKPRFEKVEQHQFHQCFTFLFQCLKRIDLKYDRYEDDENSPSEVTNNSIENHVN